MKDKRLVKSEKANISCSNCGDIVNVGTSRIIENGLHRHFICEVNKQTKLNRVIK